MQQFNVSIFSYVLILVLVFNQTRADSVQCPNKEDFVQLPSPSSCSDFYKCDRGEAVLQKCPEGLHYSTWSKICDYPERANCQLGMEEEEAED